jgi:hypothetical protein
MDATNERDGTLTDMVDTIAKDRLAFIDDKGLAPFGDDGDVMSRSLIDPDQLHTFDLIDLSSFGTGFPDRAQGLVGSETVGLIEAFDYMGIWRLDPLGG